eukprot:3471519-Pleurochrysis_carterae.AAC.1
MSTCTPVDDARSSFPLSQVGFRLSLTIGVLLCLRASASTSASASACTCTCDLRLRLRLRLLVHIQWISSRKSLAAPPFANLQTTSIASPSRREFARAHGEE